MRLNPVLAELGSSPMAPVQQRARELRDAGERLVDFSIGDPREPTPSFIAEALRTAVPVVSQYPTVDGLAGLREAIAGYVHRRFGVAVDPATQIVPTCGSKEAIFTSHLAFIEAGAGQTVMFGSPAYPIYERGARFAGAGADGVLLGGDFVLRPGDIPPGSWEAARMLWLCTPHNPAGSVTGGDDLAGFVAAAATHDVLLCSDECYADLYDAEPPPSVLQAAGPGSEGVLAFLSLSKRSGMTGYRSGAIVGDPAAIAALKALRTSVGVAPPEFVQAAAAAAWSDDLHAAERREIFATKRSILRAAFVELGFEVAGSEAGIYLWVRVGDDESAVIMRLLEAGVVAAPGSAFGKGGAGYIRFALVPSIEECRRAVEVLRSCLTTAT